MNPMHNEHRPKKNKSYFFATLALLLTLCISITGLIWLHTTQRSNVTTTISTELNEHVTELHAKLAAQQRELWELRARLHNLEQVLQNKLTHAEH